AIGDLTRFAPPRERMQCLGLTPSASATGDQRRQGAMTTAGHTQARRALVEGAWASPDPPTGSRQLPRRLGNQPRVIQDSRWPAQGRLWRRSRRRGARGTHANVGTGAMARELAGLLWALATQGPVTPSGPRTQHSCTLNSDGCRRASAKTPPWCGVTLAGVQRLVAGYACRERGRHPAEARQVGAHPPRAAGSTVVASWLRLFRCTEVQKTVCRPKNICGPLLTLEVIATLRLSRARKLKRSVSCRASAPGRC